MLSILQFVVGLVVIFALFAVATNKKFRRRLVSFWGRKTDEVSDNFGNVITDTKDALKNAHKEVESFEDKVARVMADIKIATKTHASKVADAEKWARIAKSCLENQDEANARIAVKNKQKAEKEALAIKTQTDLNIVEVEKLKSQLLNRKDQIESAENDIVVQEARLASCKMRDDMLAAGDAFGGSFNDLEAAKKEIDRYEAELNAKDELTGTSAVELEQLYSINTDVDAELAALKSSINTQASATTGK